MDYHLTFKKKEKNRVTRPGFYRTQYPASYTHKSLGRTHQFTLPASSGTQMCLLCLSLKSQIPKLVSKDSGFPIFTGQYIYKKIGQVLLFETAALTS